MMKWHVSGGDQSTDFRYKMGVVESAHVGGVDVFFSTRPGDTRIVDTSKSKMHTWNETITH